MRMNRFLIWPAVLLCIVLGCRQRTTKMTYAEALHQARTSIFRAVHEDASLSQMQLNAASSIAVQLAETEAEYWRQHLIERQLPGQDWDEKYRELDSMPVQSEGGSMEPLERNVRSYLFLEETITAMIKQMQEE